MHKKLPIAIGITILFLGIAINHAFADNPISSDNEEDCNLCVKKVSKPYLVLLKSLINRVETLDNKFSVISKYNPIVSQKYQELSNKITTIKEMNKGLKLDRDNPIICTILMAILLPIVLLLELIESLGTSIISFVLSVILIPFMPFIAIYYIVIYSFGVTMGCWDFPEI